MQYKVLYFNKFYTFSIVCNDTEIKRKNKSDRDLIISTTINCQSLLFFLLPYVSLYVSVRYNTAGLYRFTPELTSP